MRDEGKWPKISTNTADSYFLFNCFLLVLYAPYWTNVIEAWEKRNDPNFLFLFYEDLKMVSYLIHFQIKLSKCLW